MFRVVPVLFGVGLILLTAVLSDGLGRPATLIAALLTAVSPAMVYYSRYYIQETLLVFFTFAAVAAGWRLWQCVRLDPFDQNVTRRPPYSGVLAGASRSAGVRAAATHRVARLWWILALGVSIGLMHATKETCVIAWGCLLAAGLALPAACRSRALVAERPTAPPSREEVGESRSAGSEFRHRASSASHPTPSSHGKRINDDAPGRGVRASAPGGRDTEGPQTRGAQDISAPAAIGIPRAILRVSLLGAILGTAAMAAVSVTLFSGLGSNWSGPLDSVRAFATYFRRAGEGGAHVHPWYYYLHLLVWWRYGAGPVWTEGFIVALAIVGALAAALGRGAGTASRTLPRLLTIYTALMLVAYSAIPYKTPWCILSALHGLILLAGVGAATLLHLAGNRALRAEACRTCSTGKVLLGRFAAGALLLAGTAHLGWQAKRAVSPRFCASHYNPYAYSYTVRDVEDLAAQLDELAELAGGSGNLLIKVFAPNPWPLPWYLRCFELVGYWESVPDDPDADVILVSHALQGRFEESRKTEYQLSYRGLRRDEVLSVYIRRHLWDAYLARHRGGTAETAPP